MKHYKVWITLEEYDTKTQSGEELDLPFGCKRTFTSHQAAVDYATALQEDVKPLSWRGRGEKVA